VQPRAEHVASVPLSSMWLESIVMSATQILFDMYSDLLALRQYMFDWADFGIRRTDLVLEVASGNHPNARSDVLCDMFMSDSTERPWRSPLIIDRPFVCANAERLPFRTAAFDFLISVHTLEHLTHPQDFLTEAVRVSRRGVIVTPSEISEKMLRVPTHRWLVASDSGKLVLTGKTRDNWGLFGDTFNDARRSDARFRAFYYSRRDIFETRHAWEGTIDFEIRQASGDRNDNQLVKAHLEGEAADDRELIGCAQVAERSAVRLALTRRVKRIIGASVRLLCSAHRRVDVLPLLVCPICKGAVEHNAARSLLVCPSCAKGYPLRPEGVPVMLAEMAVDL